MFDDWADEFIAKLKKNPENAEIVKRIEEIEESRQETKRHRPYRMDREKKKGLMD